MPLTAPFAFVALCALALVGFVQLKLLAIARGAGTPQAPQAPRVAAAVLAVAGLAGTGAVSLGVAGAAGLAAVGTTLIERGPVRSVQIERAGLRPGAALQGPAQDLASALQRRAERSLEADADFPLELTVDWEGDVSPARVRRWLEREAGLDVELIQAVPVLQGGEPLTRLRFGLDLSSQDRADLQDLVLALNLPRSIRFEIH